MTLETPRLILRQWRDSDVDEWVRMGADPRVMLFFPSLASRERAEAQARSFREQLARDGYGWWVIEVKDGPSFAGVIALNIAPEHMPFRPRTEVGWRLPVATWGKGYATEAARAVIDHAFNVLDWPELVSMTAVLNIRSQAVMRRLGMTHDASEDFDHPDLAPGNPLRPHLIYRLTR